MNLPSSAVLKMCRSTPFDYFAWYIDLFDRYCIRITMEAHIRNGAYLTRWLGIISIIQYMANSEFNCGKWDVQTTACTAVVMYVGVQFSHSHSMTNSRETGWGLGPWARCSDLMSHTCCSNMQGFSLTIIYIFQATNSLFFFSADMILW